MAIQEGCWDCPSCDGTNLGRHVRCQGCGEPRGEDVEFYLPDDAADILEDNPLYAQATTGPDWICGYCDASNTGADEKCKGCGAGVDDGKHRQVKEVGDAAKPAPPPPDPRVAEKKPEKAEGGGCGKLLLAGFVLFVLFVWWSGRTSTETLKVTRTHWERTLVLEDFKTYQEEDWQGSVPSDARVHSRENRHKTDRDVLVRTETRYRKTSKKVPDGTEKYKCGKIDMGNGFFKDKFCERTKYKSVSVDEPYEHKVYRKEPVYEDWVRYEVDRWRETTPRTLSGDDLKPRWPDFTPTNTLRQKGRKEVYTLHVEGKRGKFEKDVPEAFFMKAPVGTKLVGDVTNSGKLVELRFPGEKKK